MDSAGEARLKLNEAPDDPENGFSSKFLSKSVRAERDGVGCFLAGSRVLSRTQCLDLRGQMGNPGGILA